MSRRRKNQNLSRTIKEDPIYNNITVARFINKLMWDGKKEKSRQVLYQALEKLKTFQLQGEPLEVFKKAVDNCKPSLEVRSRRIGGATYQVPADVRPSRRLALSIRWIVANARARKGKSMADRLAAELADAYNNKGNSIKKKDDLHRMAESNRAFSHYNW